MQKSLKNSKHATITSSSSTTKTNAKRSFSTTRSIKKSHKNSSRTTHLYQQQRRTMVTEQALYERTNKYPLCIVNQLPNGLRVASEHANSQLACVSVTVEAGSRFENEENNGTAHFLEHCFFKGTTKRSRRELETLVENIGGSLNAFTTREQVNFTITTQRQHLPIGVELLSDMIQNSTLTEQAVNAERHPILEEYESVMNELQETTYDQLHASIFRGSSLANDILGPVKNIRKISKTDVENYRRTHYTADKLVVTGVGDFTAEELQSLVSKNFATLPTTHPPTMIPNRGSTPQWTSTMHHFNDTNQRNRPESGLALAFPTPGFNHPDHYALLIIQMALGNLDSPSDVAYIDPFNTQYSDISLFGAYLQAPQGEMAEYSLAAFDNYVQRLKEAPGLLEPARDQLKSTLLSQYEGVEAINNEVCRQVLSHGRRIHPTETLDRVNNVNEHDINRIIKEWFNFDKLSGAIVGTDEDVPDLNELKSLGKKLIQ